MNQTQTDPDSASRRFDRVLNIASIVCLAASLIVPCLVIWAFFHLLGKVSDFPEYYSAARFAITGNPAGTYDLSQMTQMQHQLFPDRPMVAFYMLPPGLLFVMPFGLLPIPIAATVWMSIQLAALAGSFYLLKKLFPGNMRYYAWAACCLCWSGPLYETLRLGQPAPVLLFCMLLALLAWRDNKPAAGACSLILFAVKPHLVAPFIIALLGAKQYKYVLYSICVFGAIFALSLALFGPQTFLSYFHSLSEGMKLGSNSLAGAMATDLNPTVRGQLLRISALPTAMAAAGAAIAVLVSYVLIFVTARRYSARQDSYALAAITALPLGVLTALHCHDYDLLILVPALIAIDFISNRSGSAQDVWVRVARAGFLVFYFVPIFIFLHYRWLLELHGVVNALFLIVLVLAVACIRYVRIQSAQKEKKDTA